MISYDMVSTLQRTRAKPVGEQLVDGHPGGPLLRRPPLGYSRRRQRRQEETEPGQR